MDHTSRAVLARAEVDSETNEITRFRPRWTAWSSPTPWSLPMRSTPTTARRQAGHRQARRLPAGRQGQPACAAPAAQDPAWREVPVADHTRDRGPGRVEVR